MSNSVRRITANPALTLMLVWGFVLILGLRYDDLIAIVLGITAILWNAYVLIDETRSGL